MDELIDLPDILLHRIVELALLEDLGQRGDITSNTLIKSDIKVQLNIVTREAGVICGLRLVYLTFKLMDKDVEIDFFVNDGDKVKPQTIIGKIFGNARALLASERTALNFLTLLSGISTQTRKFVDTIISYPSKITCTRKTIPNFRILQKYAVRCGGALNHRMNLSDAILIKDNHIAIVGDISQSIIKAKQVAGHSTSIEIEVDNLDQLKEALKVGVNLILLDNMELETLKKAVSLCCDKAKTEASGGITLSNVEEVAKTGVDFIAVGALTHSFKSLDIGLDYCL